MQSNITTCHINTVIKICNEYESFYLACIYLVKYFICNKILNSQDYTLKDIKMIIKYNNITLVMLWNRIHNVTLYLFDNYLLISAINIFIFTKTMHFLNFILSPTNQEQFRRKRTITNNKKNSSNKYSGGKINVWKCKLIFSTDTLSAKNWNNWL